MLALQKEVQPYFDQENSFPVEERARFSNLFKWLRENGAVFDKLKLVYFGPGYRGIMAARDIKQGETVVFIPEPMMCFSPGLITDLQKHVYQANIVPLQHWQHVMACLFLLEESKKPDGFWRPYMDTLPLDDCSMFPLCYDEEDFQML